MVFARAAGAICGMVEAKVEDEGSKPLVVASMFGNSTDCVNEAKRILEEAGYEVLVFHATGTGGRAMESLIASGMVAGVLDITTTEWADEITGATLSAGPERLDATAAAKVPSIVVPGCVDMANFGEPSTVPERYSGRNFYIHNPQVTLMRTSPAECAELGRIIAEKVNSYTAPTAILLPRKGVSVISAEGGPFYDPVADEALFSAIRANSHKPVLEYEETINSPVFARACAEKLLELMVAAG
ncbi:MAG: Tm-1-like ATP-binding domain-containing protein [Luteolibacter sp.]